MKTNSRHVSLKEADRSSKYAQTSTGSMGTANSARIVDLCMSVAAARKLIQSADASKAVEKTKDLTWMFSKHWIRQKMCKNSNINDKSEIQCQ